MFSWLAQFHVDLVSVPGLEKLTLAEHRGIFQAIADRDPDAAGKAMSDHSLPGQRALSSAAQIRPLGSIEIVAFTGCRNRQLRYPGLGHCRRRRGQATIRYRIEIPYLEQPPAPSVGHRRDRIPRD